MTKRQKLILAAIFIAGFFFRVYRLNLNLPELYSDEVGQYQTFVRLSQPPQLTAGALFTYLQSYTVSLTWLFGLNPLGVRLPSAIYGTLIPLSLFYFASSFKSKNRYTIALVAAALGAFLPWSFMISRIGHAHVPLIVGLASLSIGLYVRKKYKLSFIITLIAGLFYPSILFVLPFVALVYLYDTQSLNKLIKRPKQLLLVSMILITAFLTIIIKYQGLSLFSRGLDLAIWRDPNTTYLTDKYRAASWHSQIDFLSFGKPSQLISNPILYNKIIANVNIAARNFLSFFSPDFLFLTGDPILRHSTGEFGSFYLFLLPFLLTGIQKFFSSESDSNRFIFLAWIIGSPLSATITKDGSGYILRAITLLPVLTILIAIGILYSFTWFKKIPLLLYQAGLLMITIYSVYGLFFSYFHVYPYRLETARSFEYGFKALADFQTENNNATLLIIWDGYYPQYHFNFWQNTSPKQYSTHKFEDIVVAQSHFYHPSPTLYFVKPFTKEDMDSFIDIHNPDYLVLPNKFFVNYTEEIVPNTPAKKLIIYPSGETAFSVYSLK